MKFKYLLLYIGFNLAIPVWAQPVDHLYEAWVPAQGRTDAMRIAALNRALRQVIVKVAGTRTALKRFKQTYTLKEEKTLMGMIQSFEYRNESTIPGQGASQSLAAILIPDVVNPLLEKNDIPRWTQNRPLILIWMVMEEQAHSGMVNPETRPEVVEHIKRIAWQRGLPVLFPALDLEDLQNLPAPALTRAGVEKVNQASARYAPDLILIVRLRVTPQGWQTEWQLFNNDSRLLNWNRSGEKLPALLRAGIHTLTDNLAAQSIRQSTTPPAAFELVIEHASRFSDYTRVRDYLSSLDNITRFQLLEMEPGQLRFQLEVRGGKEGFSRITKLGRVLIPLDHGSDELVVYQLMNY